MRIAARLMISIVAAGLLFVLGVFATFTINLAVLGWQEFDGDAGAKFGLFGESLLVGAVLALIGFVVGAKFSLRILPDPPQPRPEP